MGSDNTDPMLPQDQHVDTSPSPDQLPMDEQPGEDCPTVTWQHKLLKWLARNLHYFTFLPLILISVLQGVNLFLAALVCTGLVLLILLISYCGHRAGFVKVFPKPFDLFNLALYGSMIPLALAAHDWLRLYMGVLTNAGNAGFMWATIILPCTDNFVMHTVRERVPEHVARHPVMQRMALLIALTWASALTIMTAGAAVGVAARLHRVLPSIGVVVVINVLSYAPLVLALPAQLIIARVYKKRLLALLEPQQQQASHVLQQDGHGTKDSEAAV